MAQYGYKYLKTLTTGGKPKQKYKKKEGRQFVTRDSFLPLKKKQSH